MHSNDPKELDIHSEERTIWANEHPAVANGGERQGKKTGENQVPTGTGKKTTIVNQKNSWQRVKAHGRKRSPPVAQQKPVRTLTGSNIYKRWCVENCRWKKRQKRKKKDVAARPRAKQYE